VVTVGLVSVVVAFALGAADLARVLVAVARAQTAADSGALAAAQELAIPSGLEPEDLAREYARRNGGELLECDCAVGTFEATVRVRVDAGELLLLGGHRFAEARARAVVDLPTP
jgi:secretion/DNA translocation related TadE-like protein